MTVAFNAAGLVGEYRRAGQATWTAFTLGISPVGTWLNGGWASVDGGLTGAAEVGIPNAAIAAGVPWAVVRYYGAANMNPVNLYYELDAVDYQSATGFISSVPALGAAGLDAIICDGGFNFRQTQSLILDAVSAPLTGLPAGPIEVRDAGNTVNRIMVAFDSNNNRTAVTYNPPA